MMFAMMFVFWRILEILTLIPIVGLLAYFVDQFNRNNAVSPPWLLCLFIVSVLALTWAIATVFAYHRSSMNAFFVGFIDLCFVGAFIASVVLLSWIGRQSCTNVTRDGSYTSHFWGFSFTTPTIKVNNDGACSMIKAAWALAILNIFFWLFSAILALLHGNNHDNHRRSNHRRSSSASHRHHRSSSHQRRRSTSRHSGRGSVRHSHHSRHTRRVYV